MKTIVPILLLVLAAGAAQADTGARGAHARVVSLSFPTISSLSAI